MNKNITDIVIISYNTNELTLECIESVYKTADDLIDKIIVVDNASEDDSVNAIKQKFPDVKLIKNSENLGYAKAVNIGVKASSAEYVIISNQDVLYHADSIKLLIEYIKAAPKVGAAGPQQIYPDGSWQYSKGDLPGIKLGLKKLFLINHIAEYVQKSSWKKGRRKTKPEDTSYLDGAVIAVRRKAFDDVNGFDEDYFFYTEEADFCYKLKKEGWNIKHIPVSIVTHFRGATDNHEGINIKRLRQMIGSKRLFCEKRISFQETKFYMICEILYSLNMTVIWFLINLFLSGENKKKSKMKIELNRLFFQLWIDEFNKFLIRNEQ
ncbi:glycosyltransferase family 2 protein [Bacteroidota bacterium]